MMRVLTVRQPWAWAIIHGGKDVENRVRNLAGSYRGPVAIHAGLSGTIPVEAKPVWDSWLAWWEKVGRPGEQRGYIIGVVDLRATHHAEYCIEADEHEQVCSRWAEPDGWHLELSNPRALAEPIPFKGALGLRTLPADIEAQIARQS